MERTCPDCGAVLPPPARVWPRPLYCTVCSRERTRASQRVSARRPEYRERQNAQRRRRYADNPAFAAERKQRAHEYRLAHPEHVAEKKREWARKNPEKVREAVQQFKVRNPVQAAARVAVKEAIRTGRLVPQPCHCGEQTTEAHHHLGYDLEHWLDVVWVCRKHHREIHRKYPR